MNQVHRWYSKATHITWTGLLKLQRVVMLVSICFCTTAVVVAVFMRYIVQAPIIGIDDLATYVAFWLYFVGASYGAYERSHIKAELVHLIFRTQRTYVKVRVATSFINFGLACYVIPWAYQYTAWGFTELEQSRSAIFGSTYPVVYFQISITFAFILMAMYFLIEAIQWWTLLVRGIPLPEEMSTPRKEIDSWI